MNEVIIEEPSSDTSVALKQSIASPLDLPVATFKEGLDRRRENRRHLMEWIRDALVEGTDFGPIHIVGKSKCPNGNHCTIKAHFSKPVMFKPGAEKICGMLGVTVAFPTLSEYEAAAIKGVAIKTVILRCQLISGAGMVVAEGVGCRALDQDYGDMNKSLKMAEKSAHIDATLRMAGLSELFTQDLDQMAQDAAKDAPDPTPAPAAPRPKTTTKDVLPKEATPEQFARFIKALEPVALHAAAYFVRKGWIQKGIGTLGDLALRHVPKTKKEFDSIMAEIQAFVDGGKPETEEWYWKVIVPIPHKGQKRDEYMKDPDTIKSLYDAMKAGDAEAGRRLWGFVHHFEPKGWVKNDGTKMPASEPDFRFREALDAYDAEHGDHSDPDGDLNRHEHGARGDN